MTVELGTSATRPKRVAFYVRSSLVRQEHSTAAQLDMLRQVAHQRGWMVVGEYADVGQSGAKDRRPQLDLLLKQVHRGGIDIVACFKFDRFARSVRHLVIALDDFRARGIDFVSVSDSIDTSTPTGRFAFSLIAAVAELEREIIRERTRCGLAAARRRGARIGRPRVRIDVHEAQRLLEGGLSVRKTARKLGCGASTLARALRAVPSDDVDQRVVLKTEVDDEASAPQSSTEATPDAA